MSKFQSEMNFANAQNTPTTSLFELGLEFLSSDMAGGDSGLLNELSALLLSILRSPPGSPPPPRRRKVVTGPRRQPPMTPAAIAAALLGASTALVLCGSVTFVIGMMMMPWVIGLVIFCYFMGIISSLKSLGKVILCFNSSSSAASRSSPKEANCEYSCKK